MERNVGQEGLCGGARHEQAIATALVASLSLIGAESREVLLVLDLLPHAPGARVASDLGVAVEHAHGGLRSDEREGLLDQGVRDGVVVFVEAQVRSFSRRNGSDRVCGKPVLGERQESGLLLNERLGDALFGVARNETLMGDVS